MDNTPEVAVGVVKAARARVAPDEPEALQSGGIQGLPPRWCRPCAVRKLRFKLAHIPGSEISGGNAT
eukprot:1146729-Alexandrium_andersonii.AAC.1